MWVRLVNIILGWRTGVRVAGEWYWVTNGADVWPAIYSEGSAGGWSNYDTWEDFDHEVVAWKRIHIPVYKVVKK